MLLYGLLVLATAEFIWRGPLRNLRPTNWNDLAQNYAAARLWLKGENFARPENFANLWKDEVGEPISVGTPRTHLAPPPGTLVLLAPIGALPWPMAKLAWLALLIAAALAIIWSLAKWVGFEFDEPRTVAFVAFCLALAPIHTGIAAANETIIVVALCAVGILVASGKHDTSAGLFLGAACSLKPHLGSFLVLYYLLQRRWKLFGIALGFTACLAVFAILRLQLCGVAWLHDYFKNVEVLATRNRIDDFTSANPIRFMLINLQVLVYSFTHNAISANLIALMAGSLLILIWMILTLRSNGKYAEWLSLAAISVIGLLPIYHRLYDASLLTIPICWCMSQFNGELKISARAALVLMTPFLLPGAALLQQLARNGRVPSSWVSSPWWERFVMPHQTWLLLLLALVLLYALGSKRLRRMQ